MSESGFLKRWSRRKRSTGAAEPDPVATEPGPAGPPASRPTGDAGVPPDASAAPAVEDVIDPATLPPLESLGADSDYTVFLKKGVPEPLRIAALRKAWMSDPFIRDFRGPAEYALDYTTAEFDLLPTDDVAKLLARIYASRGAVSAPADEADAAKQGLSVVVPEPANIAPPSEPATSPAAIARSQPAPEPRPAAPSEPPAPRRKHGGAMPH